MVPVHRVSLPLTHSLVYSLLTCALVDAYWTVAEQLQCKVVSLVCIIDLPALGGRARLEAKGYEVFTIVSFEGH